MRIPFAALAVMVAALLLPQAGVACAAQPTPAGLWEQVDSAGKADGWFLISKRGDSYRATLVKLFVKPGANPDPLCTKCPVDQKNLPWLGLTIIRGMHRQGSDYDSGIVLDPERVAIFRSHTAQPRWSIADRSGLSRHRSARRQRNVATSA
jgi:Uncharacterized protein conserved in bacteria (DUF2147)